MLLLIACKNNQTIKKIWDVLAHKFILVRKIHVLYVKSATVGSSKQIVKSNKLFILFLLKLLLSICTNHLIFQYVNHSRKRIQKYLPKQNCYVCLRIFNGLTATLSAPDIVTNVSCPRVDYLGFLHGILLTRHCQILTTELTIFCVVQKDTHGIQKGCRKFRRHSRISKERIVNIVLLFRFTSGTNNRTAYSNSPTPLWSERSPIRSWGQRPACGGDVRAVADLLRLGPWRRHVVNPVRLSRRRRH